MHDPLAVRRQWKRRDPHAPECLEDAEGSRLFRLGDLPGVLDGRRGDARRFQSGEPVSRVLRAERGGEKGARAPPGSRRGPD